MITHPVLDDVRHGFLTRQGGVSTGLYDSLNCGFGSGDAPQSVAANRAPSRLNVRASTWIGCDGTMMRILVGSACRHSHRHIGPFSVLAEPVTK